MQQRGRFGSRFVAVMALAGSAIGLGNIWRFPYMVGQHGGSAFIIVYILCSVLFSLPVFFAEGVIGKSTRKSTYDALAEVAPRTRWYALVTIIATFVLLSYYSVVGGWSVGYFVRSFTGGFAGLTPEQSVDLFGGMQASVWQPLVCLYGFLLLNAIIVAAGVEKGIGGFSKVMMPLLLVLIVVIVVRSLTLPGASAGVAYLVKPDFSALNGPAIAAAMGQSFFSLSLGVGMVLTYSSYMKEDESILATGLWTAIFDTGFAILAGFAIMPAVFASGLEPGAGPALVFETLPVIFSRMGVVVPVMFFAALLLAALTSSISIMEVCVSYLVDHRSMRRGPAVLLVTVGAMAVGTLCALLPSFFSACDFAISNIFMMLGSLLFVVVVGWVMPKERVASCFGIRPGASGAVVTSGLGGKVFPLLYFSIKWIAPVAIIVIAVTNLL